MAAQIYTAINPDAGVIPELHSEKKTPENEEKMRAGICVGFGGGFCFLILLTVPILSIVFSQVFPWQEDGSVCDPKKIERVVNSSGVYEQQVKCTCREDFPTYMLVAGVLGISVIFFLMISTIGFFAKGSGSSAKGSGPSSKTAAIVGCFGLLVAIASFVITVLLFESLFSSDSKCGESLWQYGIFLFVASVLSFISTCCSLNGRK
jgi:hypothetical protein